MAQDGGVGDSNGRVASLARRRRAHRKGTQLAELRTVEAQLAEQQRRQAEALRATAEALKRVRALRADMEGGDDGPSGDP